MTSMFTGFIKPSNTKGLNNYKYLALVILVASFVLLNIFGFSNNAARAASVAYVQSCHNSANAATVTCVFGTNIAVGNVIAVFTGEYNTVQSVSGITDTLVNTYTIVDNPTNHASANGA